MMEATGDSSTVRIAYLFLVHGDPELLGRTIRKLQSDKAWFFIHVDAKSDQSLFEGELAETGARIVFAARRQSIFWMGYRMVEASLSLLAECRAHGERHRFRFDYHVHLSGSDYPIKPAGEIEDTLGRSFPANFLMYWRLGDLPDWLHKVEQYHYLDSKWHNQRAPRMLFGLTAWSFHRIERIRKIAHRFIPKRRLPGGLVPFGGSQWWMLTSDAVDYILDCVEKNPTIPRFFRFTHSPDELFFQTILMNSPLKETVAGEKDYEEFINAWKSGDRPEFVTEKARLSNLRYIDWEPGREFPSILDERDYEGLKSSGCLFARKMDPVRSKRLMEMIDE